MSDKIHNDFVNQDKVEGDKIEGDKYQIENPSGPIYINTSDKKSSSPINNQLLYKRMAFLENITDNDDIIELQKCCGELIRFVKTYNKGDFYASEIGSLIRFEPFIASVSIPFGGQVPQWYADGKTNERPRYIEKLRKSKGKVFDLIEEMLSNQ